MNNKVWIFYSQYIYNKKIKSGYVDELVSKANEKNILLEVKNIHEFAVVVESENNIYYKGMKINKEDLPKIAIFRRYEIYLARQLELLGVIVINSCQSMIDARNKLKVHQLLSHNAIKTPKSVYVVPRVCLKNLKYSNVENILGEKFVMKWIYGAAGDHVFLVDNELEFNRIMKKYNGKIICQEFISSSFGRDIRAYVINGKFLGAAIRESNGDFRSNLAQGGHALKYESNKKIEKIAEECSKITGLDICGVDILFGENDTYYVCEVNALPGFKSIKKTCNIDEKDILVNLICDKIS